MTVLNKLASSLGRKDEEPNNDLAREIAASGDKAAVKELIDALQQKKRDIQSDAIKTLYELGDIKPALLADYIDEFAALLTSKNNRLQWGGMAALSAVTLENPKALYTLLPQILDAAEKGSVITRDETVKILSKLGTVKEYNQDVFDLLNEQLLKAPVNQFAMYAEYTFPIVSKKNKEAFIDTLKARLGGIDQESKQKRINKILKKAEKI
jgi:hypothetical protein